jgi:hypothetical protein
MPLNPFRSKRRASVDADLWGVPAKFEVDPNQLTPGSGAGHDVSLHNKDTMAYRFALHGKCGPLLRYGSTTDWDPPVVSELKPGERTTVEGRIGLPKDCDLAALPCRERITVQIRADPLDLQIAGQVDAVHCELHLKR